MVAGLELIGREFAERADRYRCAMVAGPPVLNIVVPCYNEEAVLPETARRLDALLDRLITGHQVHPDSGVWFVDDGSQDTTWTTIAGLAEQRPDRWHGVKLSRNRGHQNALLAGLRSAPGDVLVSIDADLQDDVAAIETMLRAHANGADIVYGVRDDRQSDSTFKRRSAVLYYQLLAALGVEIVPDHADFRLLSRRAVTALAKYSEVNLFLRAIVPLLGFPTAIITYRRNPRFAGESKYPLSRMIGLAINGITSFSMRPLRFITYTGLLVSATSFIVVFWALGVWLFTADAVPGWTSTIVPLAFVGGLQLLALGIIGEYVGKIYLEVKRRPNFEIEQII